MDDQMSLLQPSLDISRQAESCIVNADAELENKPCLVEVFLVATIALQRSGAYWPLAEVLSLL